MEVSFDVKITPGVLYDYLLYHTYTGTTGLLGTIAGALLVAAYFMAGSILYLIFGVVVLVYLPWTLFIRSKKQYLANPAFKEIFLLPWHRKCPALNLTYRRYILFFQRAYCNHCFSLFAAFSRSAWESRRYSGA